MRLSDSLPSTTSVRLRSTLVAAATILAAPVGIASAQGALAPNTPIYAGVTAPNGFTCSANAPAPFGNGTSSAGCTVAGPMPGSAQASVNGGVLSTATSITGPTSPAGSGAGAGASALWLSAINACYSSLPGHNGCSATDTPFSGEIVFYWAMSGLIQLQSPGTSDMDPNDRGSANYDYRLIAYYQTLNGFWSMANRNVTGNFNSSFFTGDVQGAPFAAAGTAIVTTGPTTIFAMLLNNSVDLRLKNDVVGGFASSTINAEIASVKFLAGGVDVTDQVAYSFAHDPVTATPEPASMALMATGLAGIAGWSGDGPRSALRLRSAHDTKRAASNSTRPFRIPIF